MKKFTIVALVLLLVGAGLTLWFVDRGGIFRTEHRAYRFEVTVKTPDGLKTAYSVHEITIQDTTGTPAHNYQIKLVGEAVPFVLQDGRILFATLRSRGSKAFQPVIGSTLQMDFWIDIPEHFDQAVSESLWPRLAIIDGVDRPDSLRMLDDESQFTVTAARLISTQEKLTNQVSDLLPWLVGAIREIPFASTQITEHHKIISSLKFGVRG